MDMLQKQAHIVADSRRVYARAKLIMEAAARKLERDLEILNQMREKQENFTRGEPVPVPGQPPAFQSQYDQFNKLSRERLQPASEPELTGSSDILKPTGNQPANQDERWTTLAEMPNKKVYTSGQYIGTGHKSIITNSKEYEYELSARALPISVGDVVTVPVHPTGHTRYPDSPRTTNYLQYRVSDIYSKRTYHAHDLDTLE